MEKTFFETAIAIGADGIDFMSIKSLSSTNSLPVIIAQYNTDQLKDKTSFPRSAYKYWKIVEGKKKYISTD